MIVNQVQRSLQPPLHADGAWLDDRSGLGRLGAPFAWSLAQDATPSPTPTTPGTGTISAGRVIGTLFVTVLGFGAIGLGAYIGAKESRKWAAGGAMIGNLAATGLLLLTTAIATQARQP